MLISLEMNNFRQHRAKKIDFVPGFNLVRGENESGKTTLIEAIAYAWFGANALEEAISDVVTWGEPTNTLKVRLSMKLGAGLCTVVRSPSGAEIRYNGETVTGQTECTKFFASHLGVPPNVAASMMLVNQQDIRGIIKEGTGKAVTLIDRLARLGVIDQIIKYVTTKYPTGSDLAAENAVTSTAQALALVDITEPDLTEERAQVAELEAVCLGTRKSLEAQKVGLKALQGDLVQANAERGEALAARATYEARKLEREQAEASVARAQAELAGIEIGSGEEARLTARLTAAGAYQAQQESKAVAAAWMASYSKLVFPSLHGRPDLGSACAEDTAAQKQCDAVIRDRLSNMGRLSGMYIRESACGLCGKALSDIPEVAAKNAEIDRQLDAWGRDKLAAEAELTAATNRLKSYEAFDRAWSLLSAQIKGEFVDVRKIPAGFPGVFTIEYVGQDLEPVDQERANQEYKAYQQKAARLKSLNDLVTSEAAKVDRLSRQLEVALPDAEACSQKIATLTGTISTAAEITEALQARDTELTVKTMELKTTITNSLKSWEARKAQHQTLTTLLVSNKEALRKLRSMNALVASLKLAKAKITEQLWDKVTVVVGTYLTQLRQKESRVTREGGKFLLNGKSANSYSGSAKDMLGLGIRIALIRVFVPHMLLMVLDEPGSACSGVREVAMLETLKSLGFQQLLYVTHSKAADSFADTVTEL